MRLGSWIHPDIVPRPVIVEKASAVSKVPFERPPVHRAGSMHRHELKLLEELLPGGRERLERVTCVPERFLYRVCFLEVRNDSPIAHRVVFHHNGCNGDGSFPSTQRAPRPGLGENEVRESYARGRCISKQAPLPGRFDASTEPPRLSTIDFTIARPSPAWAPPSSPGR